jgi:spermidine synthase
MLKKLVRIFFAFFYLIIHSLFSFHREKIIVSQRSKLNYLIIISQCGSKRFMRFNHLSNGAQSQIDLNRIDYPCVDYIQLMIVSLIYYPYDLNNKSILIIGLGGGILPRAIRKIYPNCLIRIVEIDSIVNEMAKKYFYFKEDLKMKVIICDGRIYLNNFLNETKYDIILFDAYDSLSGLPSNMKTEEFFILLKNHLNLNGGLIIFNLVCIYQSYFNIRNNIYSIFGLNHLVIFRSNDYLNIIIIASTFQSSMDNNFDLNDKLHFIKELKEKLSIDFYSLVKTKQKQIFNQFHQITNIKQQQEENISLKEFVNLV